MWIHEMIKPKVVQGFGGLASVEWKGILPCFAGRKLENIIQRAGQLSPDTVQQGQIGLPIKIRAFGPAEN
jgi:hypothetical protein